MAPYIAALIILIVAILFAVYKRVDGFEIGAVSFTKDTLVKEFLATMTAQVQQNKAMKKMIENAGDFDDDTLTTSKLNELAIGYSTSSDGKITPSIKPISKALVMAIDRDNTTLEAQIDMMEKQITSGAIQLNQKISDAMKAAGGDVRPDYTQMTLMVNQSINVNNSREAYVKSKISSTNTKASSSTTVGGVDAKDLFGAVGGVSQALKASTLTGDMESKGKAPLTTTGFTKEVEDRIAKSVATQLKDSLLSQRATDSTIQDTSCPYAQYQTTAVEQGKEYTHARPSPTPDMSEYIRKDSIPCWNCSLP